MINLSGATFGNHGNIRIAGLATRQYNPVQPWLSLAQGWTQGHGLPRRECNEVEVKSDIARSTASVPGFDKSPLTHGSQAEEPRTLAAAARRSTPYTLRCSHCVHNHPMTAHHSFCTRLRPPGEADQLGGGGGLWVSAPPAVGSGAGEGVEGC